MTRNKDRAVMRLALQLLEENAKWNATLAELHETYRVPADVTLADVEAFIKAQRKVWALDRE